MPSASSVVNAGLYLYGRALKSRQERRVTPTIGAPMISPMYSLRENGAMAAVGFICTSLLYRILPSGRALKSREERRVTPAMRAAMISPMYSLRENGAQHGGRGFHLRLSTL